jgi:hypothetical protein
MQAQISFLKRLIIGLLISAPMIYKIITADVVYGPTSNHTPSSCKQLITSVGLQPAFIGLYHPALLQGNSFPFLAKAALYEKAVLLWKQAICLTDRGENTIQNVKIAAQAVDYTVLHPSEIFSFNDIVGIRSKEKGYLPGLMYSNGELVEGIGGGICILSTLLYNAALECGLQIIERHPHSGPVVYAQPGHDAAVSYGWADLRFRNNTNYPIIIRSTVKNDQLYVAFYGTKIPGRKVEVRAEDYEEIPYKIFEKEDPSIPEGTVQVKQKARPGFSVTIVRLTYQDGKLISKEVISKDTILPRHKIILIPSKPKPLQPSDEGDTIPAISVRNSPNESNPSPVKSTTTEEMTLEEGDTPVDNNLMNE